MNGRLIGALVAIAALMAAELSTGTRVYFLLALMLAAMCVVALVSCLWTIRTLEVRVKGIRSRVLRGDGLTVLLSVRHKCLLPVAQVRVHLQTPGGPGGQEITVSTPPMTARQFRHRLFCPHRGLYPAGVDRASVTDVFGLFTLRRALDGGASAVEVAPRARRVEALPPASADMGGAFFTRATEDTASPSDIRDWQDGDSLKKVHWKLSLRRRELLVRTYEETARPDTLIVPDLSAITALPDEKLCCEDGICESALGAARAQLEAGNPVRMPLMNRHPSELSGTFPSDLAPFSDALMRAPFDSPYPYERVLGQMLARTQRTGACVLVTARLQARTCDLALQMRRSGMAVRLIWVASEPQEDELALTERLRMGGVKVTVTDPDGADDDEAS